MTGRQRTTVEQLDQAWKSIEDSIHELGAVVRRESANGDALQRFEGYKTALIALAESYINQVHYDRQRPECQPFIGSIFNYTGPSPDFTYKLVHLEPGASYRVRGRRGDAELIDLQLLAGWFGQRTVGAERSTVTRANLLFDDLGVPVDADGNFDFVLGPDTSAPQGVRSAEDVTTLLVREYFSDYGAQSRPTTFYLDKHGDEMPTETTAVPLAETVERLHAFANALKDYEFTFSIPQLHAEDGDNASRELDYGADAGVSDQRYFQAHFRIGPEQALIGRWRVPDSYLYWSTVLYNGSYQMLNYANRQVNLNHALAVVGDDGMFYFVLSHRDPGIANWLDLDGHEQGLVLTRTKGTPGPVEMPSLTLIPFDEVRQHLPGDIAVVTPRERSQALAARREHFHRREGR